MTDRAPHDSPAATKPIHTIILDTSPILLNIPSISTLLANSHALVTTQAVLQEVKGEEARTRLDTLYRPFLTIRSPRLESVKFVKEFATKTGDSGVLSATDLEVLALAYDLECERNNGDWRLRRVPGQKRVNGGAPVRENGPVQDGSQETGNTEIVDAMRDVSLEESGSPRVEPEDLQTVDQQCSEKEPNAQNDAPIISDKSEQPLQMETGSMIDVAEEGEISSDADEEGWITPSNIKRHQAQDDAASNGTQTENKALQVATMTGDFAMQNVLLQMNLNLLSTKTCKRIAHIKQTILRCHACFATTKDMGKQFCARCGKPTLTRVTCTTNDRGEAKLHLKANHQWNNRGNVFSIPKPTAGTANQKWKGPRQGGGAGGWGSELILAEDQKEYIRAMSSEKRTKKKDLMDQDILPNILTGNRSQTGGKVRVGAGRNVNSRKR